MTALQKAHLWAAALLVVAAAAACSGASATPLPPSTGDWILDPGEVVALNDTSLLVEGNILLDNASSLSLERVQLVFSDAGGKRAVLGPVNSQFAAVNSSIGALRGSAFGGFGFYLRVDGTLTIDFCSVTGLSGPTTPAPFTETEGIHLTSSTSRVANSSITGSAGYAITVSVENGPAAPTISDNMISNGGGGVYLGGLIFVTADATIEGNTFQLNALPHIAVVGSNPTIRNNSFLGSTAGIATLLSSALITDNTFLGNVLNAVSVTQGGGRIEGNTVTGTGIAFALTTSAVTIRNNTVTLSATALLASGTTVIFDDNTATGLLAPAIIANGSTVRASANTLQSSFGTAVVQATNGSTLTFGGGSLTSSGGPGITADGGALTLGSLTLNATAAPISTSGTAVTLRDATVIGGRADPVLYLHGGSLTAVGGELTGGADGARLEGATSSITQTRIHGNSGWGIRAVHESPVLSSDEILAFVNANGEGDLSYEADLTVRVENALFEPVANATVSIQGSQPGPPVSGLTGLDGRAGPIRLPVRRIDSLNNELRFGPYAVSAFYAPDARGTGASSLASDDEVQITLRQNTAPNATLDGPTEVRTSLLVSYTVTASDGDGDPLTYEWRVDDGRSFEGAVLHISFNLSGPRLLTVVVSDGFATRTLSLNVSVLTPEEANVAPVFVSEPLLDATLTEPYVYRIELADPDNDQAVFVALWEGPEGMMIHQDAGRSWSLEWNPSFFVGRGVEPLLATFPVHLFASDGFDSTEQNFTIVLRVPADKPPVISPLPVLSVESGATAYLNLSSFGSDPDDMANSLRWRVQPNEIGGAVVAIDWSNNSRLVVYAPAGIVGDRLVNFTVILEDPVGGFAMAGLTVELKGAPPAAPQGDSSLLATALALGALAVAAFAFFSRRHPPQRQE